MLEKIELYKFKFYGYPYISRKTKMRVCSNCDEKTVNIQELRRVRELAWDYYNNRRCKLINKQAFDKSYFSEEEEAELEEFQKLIDIVSEKSSRKKT